MDHAFRVGLLATVLASFYFLSSDQQKILCDAALLHDIGRLDDIYDCNHAYIGSILAESILSSQEFYQEKDHMKMVKMLIFGHDKNICDLSIFQKEELPRLKENVLLLKILKDADILDRIRIHNDILNISKINLKISKSLFRFSSYLNHPLTLEKLRKGEENHELSEIRK